MEGVSGGLIREVVVTDGGSTDETETLARALGSVWVAGPPGRGGQLRRGVEASQGQWVLLLHADTHLSPGWAAVAHHHMRERAEYAGWFQLRFRAKGGAPRLVEFGANLRARLLRLPYGDQGLLLRRSLLEEVGGVPDVPLMEDVALARALSGRLVGLDARAHTSADRYEADGWMRRVLQNLGTLARYQFGMSPDALKKRYEAGPSDVGK